MSDPQNAQRQDESTEQYVARVLKALCGDLLNDPDFTVIRTEGVLIIPPVKVKGEPHDD